MIIDLGEKIPALIVIFTQLAKRISSFPISYKIKRIMIHREGNRVDVNATFFGFPLLQEEKMDIIFK